MKFSVVLPEQHPSHADPSSAFDTLLNFARTAEEHGYYSAWIGEHQSTEDLFLHPITTLAAVAKETKRIRLGTSIIIPLHQPIELAYSLANLDVISGGRLIFSPVLGYRPEEFDAFQIPFRERGSRMEEALSIILKLWTRDRVSHTGPHLQFREVSVNPKPVQKPHPPVWVGGSSPAALTRAVRLGDSWMPMSIRSLDEMGRMHREYRRMLKSSGADLEKMEFPIFVEAYLGRNAEEARGAIEAELVQKYNSYVKWGFPISAPEGGFTFEDLSDRIIVGGPDECLGKIEKFQTMGVNHLVLRFGFKGMSGSAVLKSLRLWAEKIQPHFEPP